ncbi:MAG: D-alanyl-D-alanine carboxypeptidase family protein, partial [Pseudomonadaceae bacterium]
MNIKTCMPRFIVFALLAIVTTATPVAWAAPAIPSPPQLAAKSYMLMDAASGKVLIESNSDERLPPASLTKLMTAYIATLEIQKGQISDSDMVTVSEKAWRTGGSR